MALIKIGTKYYNGSENAVYLMQGNAVRDGEDAPINGKPHAKVSVAANESADHGTLYVTVNGWRDRAEIVASVKKMDSILVIGALKKRVYNDREYWDMDADFLCLSGAGFSVSDASADGMLPFESLPGEDAELPWNDSGELPF